MSDILTYNKSGMLDYNLWNAKPSIPNANVIAVIESVINGAEVDGFVNPVAVGTMLWLHVAVMLMPEIADEIGKISETDGVFAALDKLQADGTIAKLIDEHEADVAYVFNLANLWYKQYAKFNPTLAGQVGKLSFLTEDFVKDALEGLQKVLSEGNAEKVMQIAEAWGMDNEFANEVTTQE